jgi:hypothetical protein
VKAMLERRGHARVPSNFERTAAAHDPSHPRQPRMPSTAHRNPQTVALLQLLELPFNLDLRDAPRNPPPCPGAHKGDDRRAGRGGCVGPGPAGGLGP